MALITNTARKLIFPYDKIQIGKSCLLQQWNCLSTKKSKSNLFRKKTKQKKPKIHKQHPVLKYMNEMQDIQTESNASKSVFEAESLSLLHAIETNKSQILGFDLCEFRNRVQLFHGTGSTLSDAITLSLGLPTIFHVNNTNFKNVLKTLRGFNVPVERIIYRNPHIGAMNYRHLEMNLRQLKELVPESQLDNLILNYPQLLSFQLDKKSIDKLLKSSLDADNNHSKYQMLKASLDTPAVENQNLWSILDKSENFCESMDADVKEFLSSYDLDWKNVYLDCPEFLLMPIETIESCLEHIISSPFYFEVEDVEKLLKSRPDIFLLFSKESTIEMVKYLENIFKQKGHLYRLLSEDPEMLRDPATFFRRVEIFKKFGLKDYDIALLIAQPGGATCFTDCEEFTDAAITEMLSFYFGCKDLVALQVVFSAPACLSPKSFPIVVERIGYLRKLGKMKVIAKQRKKKRTQITIQTIIKTDLNHFIDTICGTSLQHFQSTMKIKVFD